MLASFLDRWMDVKVYHAEQGERKWSKAAAAAGGIVCAKYWDIYGAACLAQKK